MRKGVIILFITLMLAVIMAELILRAMGVPSRRDEVDHLKVTPNTFMKIDPVLGWKAGPGHFYFNFDEDKPYFECNVTAGNERFIPGDTSTLPHRRKIHLYGCSYTFGLADIASVPNTKQRRARL
jgi:hypothetical protein